MPHVVVKDLVKDFGSTKVIKGVNLEIDRGEFVVFVGPSGCGKSTLLRLIAGLEEPTSGKIQIADKDVTYLPASERKVAMVFQSYALYPHMTVRHNIGFGLKMTGVDKAKIEEVTFRAAKILKLEKLLDRKPKELSGGQKQRVAIGRAIVRDPEVFLFDEPLSNLDAELRVDMRMQIHKLNKSMSNSTMIYVTHDQVEAMTMADKIVVLRDGRIEQIGTPLELYHHPTNQFVAGFIGSPKMNFISGVLVGKKSKSSEVKLPDGGCIDLPIRCESAGIGEPVMLGLRPEDLRVGHGDFQIKVKFELEEHLGSTSYLYGTYQDTSSIVVESHDIVDRFGSELMLNINPDRTYLFSQHGHAFDRCSDLQVKNLEGAH